MFEITGPNGPQGGHKVTTKRVLSQDGEHTFIRKTVHLGLNEQKWVPQQIDSKQYSSMGRIKKLYPDMNVQRYKMDDGSILYEVADKDWCSGPPNVSITVKEDVKGTHVAITERQYPFMVTGEYLDGKLVKADKSPMYDDPYVIWD